MTEQIERHTLLPNLPCSQRRCGRGGHIVVRSEAHSFLKEYCPFHWDLIFAGAKLSSEVEVWEWSEDWTDLRRVK